MATARGLIRGAAGGVRTLSSRASQHVGRPSPSVWSNRTAKASATGKAGVNRLIRRDPAKGKSLPLADKITDTHIDLHGNTAGSISSRDRTAPPRSGVRQVENKGTNRSINKR